MLCHLTNLKDLYVDSAHYISDSGIKNLTNLTKLHISSQLVSDECLKKLTKLKSLAFSRSSISNDFLMNMTHLETLELPLTFNERDAGVENLTNLTSLVTWGSNLSGKALRKLTNLTHLTINCGHKSKYNFRNEDITHLVNLRSLKIHSRGIDYRGFSGLSKLET
jgi:hypothetical protein